MGLLQKFKKGIKYLLNSDYRFCFRACDGRYHDMPDEPYLRRLYRGYTGRKLNLENPTRFNEKMQWIKLYDRKPEYTMMVDKYLVRDYIKAKLGEQFLIPLLGVWENPEDIPFDELPDRFVLKCNHNSGTGMYICKDKSQMDVERVKEGLRKGLAEDYYIRMREWPYKNVPRRVIAEKFMEDKPGEDLNDYKVMCFNGEAKLIQIHRGRFGKHTQDFYDARWNLLDIYQGVPLSGTVMEKPSFLEEMLELSQKLAERIPCVRVDWYHAEGRLYFGELTFFDASGFDEFEPDVWNERMGSWITLPISKAAEGAEE